MLAHAWDWGRKRLPVFSQEEVSMSSSRGGLSGIAIVFLFAVVAFAAILILAAGTASSLGASSRSATSGGPGIAEMELPFSPRGLSVHPREIPPRGVQVDGTVSFEGVTGSSTLGGPGPTNPPFAGDGRVTSDPSDQTHPSIAVEPGGSLIYVAYTSQTTPTNRDVYLARSADSGATWTNGPVAAAGYNEFDPSIAIHGSTVYIFYTTDDPAIPRGFHWATSPDRGMTWTIRGIDYTSGAPFRLIRSPSASSYQGMWLYVVYQSFCDVPASCGMTTSQTEFVVMFDSMGAPVGSTIYFPFGVDMIEPTIFAGPTNTIWAADYDGRGPPDNGPPGSHDIFWFRTSTGNNSGSSWVSPFVSGTLSSDVVRAGSSGFGTNFVFPYQLANATLFGFPNHIVAVLYTSNDAGSWGLRAAAGQAGVEFKDPAAVGSAPFAHLTFYQSGNLGYSNASSPFASWPVPVKANANTGTVVDAVRSTSIAADPSLGPLLAWHDTRDGNANIYFTGLQRFTVTIATSPGGPAVSVTSVRQTAPYSFWCDASATVALDVPSPRTISPTSQYRFNTWSDAGAPAHPITCDAPKTVTANFVLQWQVTIATSPAGRDLVVDLQPRTGPYVFWCDDGSSHSINAPGPQATGPSTQYRFDTWSDAGAQTHSITCSGSIAFTANFVLQYQITISTTPAGRTVRVDGTPRTGPYTSWWDAGSNIGLLAPSPQTVGLVTRYSFSAWSDGNVAPSRTLLADQPRILDAVFTTEYYLTMTTRLGTTVNPGSGWHQSDENVAISTTGPAPGLTERYVFSAWSGDFNGTNPSAIISMNGPKTINADWAHQYKVDLRFGAGVPGTNITVDTVDTAAPITKWWDEGSTHTVAAPANLAAGSDTRYNFLSWQGAGVNRQFTVTVTGSVTYTATYTQQFLVTLIVSPSGRTILVDGFAWVPGTPLWFDSGTDHVFDAGPTPQAGAAGERFRCSGWTGGTPSANLNTVRMDTPKVLTATYTRQLLLTVVSPYGPPTCVSPAEPGTCWYTENTQAQVTVTSPVQVGGTKYVLTGWTGATSSAGSTATVTMDAAKTVTASWREVTFLEENGLYLGLLIAILIAVIAIVLVVMRRRKKEPGVAAGVPPPPPMQTQGTQMGGTKNCPACGMEIPGGATTCPVCGAAV